MYSPTAYYWGRYFSQFVITLVFPMIMWVVIFFGIGVSTAPENMALFIVTLYLNFYAAMNLGYAIGGLFESEEAAKQATSLSIVFCMLTGGAFSNSGTFPPYMKVL